MHERSIENDLALAMVRTLLPKLKSLKVILMSATFDARRFENFFSSPHSMVPIEVRSVNVPEMSSSGTSTWYRTTAFYLHNVVKLLCSDFDVDSVGGPEPASMHVPPPMHKLMCELVLHCNATLSNTQEVILVVRGCLFKAGLNPLSYDFECVCPQFLPTYRALEHLHVLLTQSNAKLTVCALHSSIDSTFIGNYEGGKSKFLNP